MAALHQLAQLTIKPSEIMSNFKDTPPETFLSVEDLQNVHYARSVDLAGSTYYLCVQGFKFNVDGKLILKNRIQLLEKAIDAENPTLIGFLRQTHNLNDTDPQMWDAPQFIGLADAENYKAGAAQWFGEDGYTAAFIELGKLTDDRILKGLRAFVSKGRTEKPYVLKLCIKDLLSKRTICVYESPVIMLFEPGKYYVWDCIRYELADTDSQDNYTCCYYFPAGSMGIESRRGDNVQ